MTIHEALALIAEALQPQTAGRITREGWAQLNEALRLVREALEPKPPPPPS